MSNLDKLKKQAESMRCPHLIHEIRQEDILIGSHSECRGAIFSPTPHSLATENARLREALDRVRKRTPESDGYAHAVIDHALQGHPPPDPREASPAPQPDAVKVLREACEWYAREFADIDAHSGTTSGTWERLATHANDRLRAALAATEGVL